MNAKHFSIQDEKDPIKVEIFSYVLGALELDRPKIMNYIYNRYGISPQVVEEHFYDACIKLDGLYHEGAFTIEYIVLVVADRDGPNEALITSQKVVTPNGYSVGAKQLAQTRSWVWKSVRFKALDYLKKDNGFSDRSINEFEEFEDFLPLEESSNPAETYVEDDTVNSIMNSMEADDEDQLGEVSSIISSTIMGMRSNRERDVVNLTFYSDMSTREIADHLDISTSNVRSIKARGLNRIKKQLKQHSVFELFFDAE